MGDFSAGFGTGFEIGAIIKEKQKAKKALEQVKIALEEWRLSGKEPSYVDKILMSTLMNQVGQNYAASFQSIDSDNAAMNREKLTQDAQNLRDMNNNVLNFTKFIQTSIEDGTIGLIDWNQFKSLMPPGFDINKFLDKDTITKLQDKSTRQEALDEVMGITKNLPEEYRKGYMEQQGVIQPGLEAIPETPKAAGISDYNSAANYLKNYANSKMSDENFNKIRDGIATKFGLDLSGMTRESLRKVVTPKAGEIITAEDVIAGKLSIIPSSVDLTPGEPTEEEKNIIRTNYKRIKDTLAEDVQKQVENWLLQINIDVNAIAPTPEPIPEPEVKQPGFWSNLNTKVKTYGKNLQEKFSNQGTQKDYTTMTIDELYELADKQNDAGAYAELKRRGYIK